MNIVSSCKLKGNLKTELRAEFSDENFIFYDAIEDIPEDHWKAADILLTYGEDLTDEIVERADNLKWIVVLSAGIDQMPVKSIVDKNILVTNSRGIHKIPMAEFTFAMMLQVAKSTLILDKQEEEQVWNKRIPIMELYGKTIVILGAGAIGTEIARLSKAFNMKTIGVNSSGRVVDFFDEMYTTSDLLKVIGGGDFIVSVLPSTKETRGLLGAEHFQAMKSEAIFINIGRGDVVNEAVLMEALNKKEFAHAVLDVFEQEPLPKNHPFWTMDNVTVTPHISSISSMYQDRCIEIFKYNMYEYKSGSKKYKNLIDITRGY